MKLKKVLVVYKDSMLEEHRKTMKQLRKIIKSFDMKSTFLSRNQLGKECAGDCDLIFSVGGDGTLLRVSHFVNATVVLGVNSNTKTSEGILCSAASHDLEEKFARIINGQFAIKKLTRARVRFLKTGRNYDALNEIYVGSLTPYLTSRYILKFGRSREEQKSSGIIIATGAGSTAWYGSVVKGSFNPELKELRFIVREPYRGKLLDFKLIKGRLKPGQKLYIESKMQSSVVAVDSIVETPFHNEEDIAISLSPQPLRIVSFV